MQYDFARTGGGADVPVTVRSVVDVARVRSDVRRLKGRGVLGRAGVERFDMERGRRRSDANADFGMVDGAIDTIDTAEYE